MYKVSIALAVYNGAKYLPELLASLEAQTYRPLELIVVDDCSSDNSVELIKNFPLSFEKKILSNQQNKGPVYSFKKLASLCSGNFIAFCDQDDIWVPEKIELSVNELKKKDAHKPGLVFSDLSIIDEQSRLLHNSFWQIRRLVHPVKFKLSDILCGNIVTGCTVTINQALATLLAKMPVDIIMHDWWLALIAYSFGSFSFISKPTVLYRSHTNSVTSKVKTTFFTVFKNEYKQGKSYLSQNIHQAIAFKKVYKDYLNTEQVKTIDDFIKLGNSSFITKRLYRDSRSIMREIKVI